MERFDVVYKTGAAAVGAVVGHLIDRAVSKKWCKHFQANKQKAHHIEIRMERLHSDGNNGSF